MKKLGLLLIFVAGFTFSQTDVISPTQDIPEVTAVQIYEEYISSQFRADQMYKGKQVKITGVVGDVSEDWDIDYYKRYALKFKTGNSSSVIIFFDKQDIESLNSVAIGQTASIIGTVIQYSATKVKVDHSKILQ